MTVAKTPDRLADEALRARKVRQLVDIATALITQSNLTTEDAEALIQSVRARILALFPDGAATYELLYARRFRRLISEYARPRRAGVVIRFWRRRI